MTKGMVITEVLGSVGRVLDGPPELVLQPLRLAVEIKSEKGGLAPRNGTIKIDLETNKIMDYIKFDVGNVVMVTGGRNTGRVGVINNREKHKGSFETIHVMLGAFCYV
ncbi:40S ribosomal protein S4-3 [Zea mays]|uniref:40S ribosomal protein S4-3 n=1 Tax=Zea mays TaxID=4577 RepID=A0A1D6EI00_MAIZE|nr:40S ribosomal protein S4-3 [Zea mays]